MFQEPCRGYNVYLQTLSRHLHRISIISLVFFSLSLFIIKLELNRAPLKIFKTDKCHRVSWCFSLFSALSVHKFTVLHRLFDKPLQKLPRAYLTQPPLIHSSNLGFDLRFTVVGVWQSWEIPKTTFIHLGNVLNSKLTKTNKINNYALFKRMIKIG